MYREIFMTKQDVADYLFYTDSNIECMMGKGLPYHKENGKFGRTYFLKEEVDEFIKKYNNMKKQNYKDSVRKRLEKLRKYEIDGKKYTGAELARAYNMNYSTVMGRLRYGYTPEEAVGLKEHYNRNMKHVIYKGKSYTVRELMELLGVARSTVENRIKMGIYKLEER